MRIKWWIAQLVAYASLFGIASAQPQSNQNVVQKKAVPQKENREKLLLSNASALIKQGKAKAAENLLAGEKFSGKDESYRLFLLARAATSLGKYEQAIQLNNQARLINKELYAAIFNNMCNASLNGQML